MPHDGRRETWTDKQILAVLGELYREKRPKEQDWQVEGRRAVGDMFVVALLTGLRAGEVRKLRKSDIDFDRTVIVVRTKKGIGSIGSGRTREVPMVKDVSKILMHRAERVPGACLFPGKEPDQPLSSYRQTFLRACERAKIPYGQNGTGTLIFNDARRTAENRMLDAGHSPRAVADIQGHSYETMARHYARSTPESRRRAIESASLTGLEKFGTFLARSNEKEGETEEFEQTEGAKENPANQENTQFAGKSKKAGSS